METLDLQGGYPFRGWASRPWVSGPSFGPGPSCSCSQLLVVMGETSGSRREQPEVRGEDGADRDQASGPSCLTAKSRLLFPLWQ